MQLSTEKISISVNCHFLPHPAAETECCDRMGRWLVSVNSGGSVPGYHADDETRSSLQATAVNTVEVCLSVCPIVCTYV